MRIVQRWGLSALVGALALACAEEPGEVLERAQMAAEADDIDALVATLTDDSADLIRGVLAAAGESGGALRYLDGLHALIPPGEVLSVDERGDRAVVTVDDRGQAVQVLMVDDRGAWRIDVRSLPGFWSPLQ